MPKIIFRPNPTPPPFDPPTPPVQNPSVFFTPYPFETDELLHAVLTNLDLPEDINIVEVDGYVEAWNDWSSGSNIQISGSPSSIECDFAFEASSSQISRYRLTCWNSEWVYPKPYIYIDLVLLN